MRRKLQLTAPTDGMQSLDGRSKWGSQVGGGSRGSRSVRDGNIRGDGKFAVVLVGGASSGRGRTQTAKGRSLSQPAPDSDKRQKLGSPHLSWGLCCRWQFCLALTCVTFSPFLCDTQSSACPVGSIVTRLSARYQLQVNAVSGL